MPTWALQLKFDTCNVRKRRAQEFEVQGGRKAWVGTHNRGVTRKPGNRGRNTRSNAKPDSRPPFLTDPGEQFCQSFQARHQDGHHFARESEREGALAGVLKQFSDQTGPLVSTQAPQNLQKIIELTEEHHRAPSP